RSSPRFTLIGLAPAATTRSPSRTIAWARTVAVVVPSPATSLVLLATSRASWAPRFSNGSLSSISLATLTPSSTMAGGPNFFSRMTLRPRGPRVTRTASASASTPSFRRLRASSLNSSCLAGMGYLLWGGKGRVLSSPSSVQFLLSQLGQDIGLLEHHVLFLVAEDAARDVLPAVLRVEHAV